MNKIILCGNPNTGKTTLFNQLSGAKEKASNWHGVTVDIKERCFEINKNRFVLCDLPGIYSLNGISEEEILASNYIKENSGEIVVCVVDANNLKRNLLLAIELKAFCDNLIIAVNMANEVKNINADKLTKELGIRVVLTDARKKKGVVGLKSAIFDCKNKLENEQKNIEEKYVNFANKNLLNFEENLANKFDYIDKILKMEEKT